MFISRSLFRVLIAGILEGIFYHKTYNTKIIDFKNIKKRSAT